MQDIFVIDDFLDKSYHQQLHQELSSPYFPWYYQSSLSYAEDHTRGQVGLGNIGFNFWIKKDQWTETGISRMLMPFGYKVQDRLSSPSILRIRIDMTLYNPNNHQHQTHVDFYNPHYSSVFYVNDSDGDTIIYNEKYNGNEVEEMKSLTVKEKISPKANRLLIFDGKYYHTGHSPSKHNNRIIINSNYSIA